MKKIKYVLLTLICISLPLYANNFFSELFSGDYTSSYDGSGLMINGPQTNLDLTLLQVRPNQNDRSYLRTSGAAELLLSHHFNQENLAQLTMSNIELQIFGSIQSCIHLFTDMTLDPDTLDNQFNSTFLTLGNLAKSPFYMTVGQYYVPFGVYNNAVINSIQDNLTEFGGVNAQSLNIGFNSSTYDWISLRLFGYKSNVEINHHHTLQGGLNIDLSKDVYGSSINFGGSVITNLADSDAFVSVLNDSNLQQAVPGLDIYATVALHHNTTFNIEYIGSIHEFNKKDIMFNGHSAKPGIIGLELSQSYKFFHHTLTSSMGFNDSFESLGLGIPKQRLYAVLVFNPIRKVSLSFQMNDDMAYATKEQSTIRGKVISPDYKTAYSAFAQLSMYF
jgi:hypothetical protein